MEKMIPFCHVHGTRMIPVSWYRSSGETTETDYACKNCIKERKQGEAIHLSPGPIFPYDLRAQMMINES